MFSSKSTRPALFASALVLALPFTLMTLACSQPVDGDNPVPRPDPLIQDDAGTKEGGNAPDSTTFCKSFCEKVQECDSSFDTDICQQDCANTNAASVPKFRSDVVADVTSCVADKDCKTVLAGDAVTECVSEAAASIAPSAAATKTCDALAATSTKCHSTFDRATCLSQAKVYNDGALANAGRCAQKACTDVDDCMEAAVGQSLGKGPTPPPPPPPGKCSSFGEGTTFETESAACNSCGASSCCTQASACEANTSCVSLIYCVSACTTEACVDACASKYSGGLNAASSLFTCLDTKCPSSCQ